MTTLFVLLCICATAFVICAIAENKVLRNLLAFPFIFLAYVMLLGMASFLEFTDTGK